MSTAPSVAAHAKQNADQLVATAAARRPVPKAVSFTATMVSRPTGPMTFSKGRPMQMSLQLLAAIMLIGAPPIGAVTARPEWAGFGEPGRTPDRTIAITATDMRFSPDHLLIRRGETIRFVVDNRGDIPHEFVIGDAAFQAQHQKEMLKMPDMKMSEANALSLDPGQTRSLTWRFTRSGEFQFACDLPDHARRGMVGHVTVR